MLMPGGIGNTGITVIFINEDGALSQNERHAGILYVGIFVL